VRAAAADPAIFSGFDPTTFGKFVSAEQAAASKPVELNFFGYMIRFDGRGVVGFSLLLLAAMVGGLLLNFTPCVLPVIPLKIMGLSESAGNPARCFMLGLCMSAGVVLFWAGIGAAIAFVSGFNAISTLFQYTWFVIGTGVLIAIMSLGLFGLFDVALPQWVYSVNPKHDSIHGSVLFGIMTAVLSTPCTAPFMGGAVAWSTQQSRFTTILTFVAIGVGMAVPYAILSANPRLMSRMPRSGPASNVVKQVLGLLMLGVAAYFIGTGIDPLLREPIDPPVRVHWWIVAAFVVAASGWMIYQTFVLAKSPVRKAVFTLIGLALAASIIMFARGQTEKGPINWVYYTPARFQEAIKRGDVVVVDFTAEWCLNCKALESGVLHREAVYERLNAKGATPIKVDITGGYPDGKKFMQELGWTSIPLLVIYGPGLAEPLKFDTYTVDTVLTAMDQARGRANAAATPAGGR
jgi:thiol:disulfide interchange protein